jgi:hypothetical protein
MRGKKRKGKEEKRKRREFFVAAVAGVWQEGASPLFESGHFCLSSSLGFRVLGLGFRVLLLLSRSRSSSRLIPPSIFPPPLHARAYTHLRDHAKHASVYRRGVGHEVDNLPGEVSRTIDLAIPLCLGIRIQGLEIRVSGWRSSEH